MTGFKAVSSDLLCLPEIVLGRVFVNTFVVLLRRSQAKPQLVTLQLAPSHSLSQCLLLLAAKRELEKQQVSAKRHGARQPG
jgi:hypothetical protein